MDDVILKLPAVKNTTGLSRSTIYAYISEGRFPKQIPLGARSVGWSSSEIGAWIKYRKSERRAA